MNCIITTLSVLEFKRHLQSNAVAYSYYQTAAGVLRICSSSAGIHEAVFAHYPTTTAYHARDILKLVLVGSPFECTVWRTLLTIPVGTTSTYQNLAHMIGHPRAWRAVANALAKNNIAYFIPCHRVIRSNGTLGGYKWGIEKKKILLNTEYKELQ